MSSLMKIPQSLDEERKYIRDGLNAKVIQGSTWQIISAQWFQKWRKYVNFDNAQDEISEHPGPIDNSDIKGDHNDHLKPGLFEGQDYILLPRPYANFLYTKYKSAPNSPTFFRGVINIGTLENPLYQIEVNLLNIHIYYCDRSHPLLTPEDTPTYVTASKTQDLPTFLTEYRVQILRKYIGNLRAWIKLAEDSDLNPPTLLPDHNNKSSTTNTNTNTNTNTTTTTTSNNSATNTTTSSNSSIETSMVASDNLVSISHRMLTSDYTERDGLWQCIHTRTSKGLKLIDLIENRPYLELLIEYTEMTSIGMIENFPRNFLLHRWKTQLRVGDMVDVCDKQNKWFESIITQIDTNGNLKVHFFGWHSSFDEIINKNDIGRKVEPLYSKTKDWRNSLQVNDEIEFNIAVAVNNRQNHWILGTVENIDLVQKNVLIKYATTDEQTYFKSLQINNNHDNIPDDLKKIHLRGTNNTMEIYDDATNMASTTVPLTKSKWVYLYSDDICELYTHLKRPTIPAAVMTPTRTYQGYTPIHSHNHGDDEYGEKHVVGRPVARGVVGLQNLGNTCFMNSILQCLSNTYLLTQYFVEDRYKPDINTENVLGHGGKLAASYAKLMKDMWSDSFTKVIPRNFKRTIGEFQPQFAGYQQQDSQELMGFLLDGLHEDLNRRLKKPAVQKIESKGRSDDIISRESWRRFLLRNDSKLIDHFYGQLKSHVKCTCGKESVTFDAFNCLSLPVPIKTTRPLTVYVRILPPGSPYIQMIIEVELTDKVGNVKEKLIKRLRQLNKFSLLSSCKYEPLLSPESRKVMKLKYGNKVNTSTIISDEQIKVDTDTPTASMIISHTGCMDTPVLSTDQESELEDDTVEVVNISEDDEYVKIDHPITTTVSDTTSHISDTTTNLSSYDDTTSVEALPECHYDKFTYYQYLEKYKKGHIDDYIFHSAVAYSTDRSRIYKNINADTPVGDFIAGRNSLLFYQLDCPCEMKSFSMYTHTNLMNNTAIDTINSNISPTVEYITYIDLYIGKLTNEVQPSHYTSFEVPYRFNITRDITGVELYEMVWKYVYRFFYPDSIYYNQSNMRPYVLYIGNITDAYVKLEVSCTDDIIQFKPEHVLIACLKSVANSPNHFNQEEFTRYELISSQDDDNDEGENMVNNDNNTLGNTSLSNAINTSIQPTYATVTRTSALNSLAPDIPDKKRTKLNTKLTIYKCLEKFCEREQLNAEETIYCSQCKNHIAPIKKFDLYATPDILIIQLKRFQYTPGQYFVHREKISDLIDFPIEGLDLTSYVKGPQLSTALPIYDLYAVSLHSGGLGGGHYTAICQNPINHKWYNFNDSFVSETSPESAVCEESYVLFYKRQQTQQCIKWCGITPLSDPGLPDEE